MFPQATYRFQFNADFTFEDAHALVPYLSRLGISRVYASPLLRARKESTHGYDVVDPKQVNPNIGDPTQLREYVQTLQAHGLGLVLDTVPNHMAASGENPYWIHVLTYGPSSRYARWFDIDFRLPDPELWGRVLVPVLGDRINVVIEDGELALNWDGGRLRICYYDHCFPVDPATVPAVFRFGLRGLRDLLGVGNPDYAEVKSILDALRQVPRASQRMRRGTELDIDEIEEHLSRLAQIIEQSPLLHQWLVQTCEEFITGEDGDSRLKKLLAAQSYRLVYWRRAARFLNYRRFFNINDLISVRQEDPEVFEATHTLIADWLEEGFLDGLRIDHIDGLRDPKQYLERLRDLIQERSEKPCPVWVEKILAPHEALPESWPTAGTSGYEFCNEAEAVFVAPSGVQEIVENYGQWLRRPADFQKIVEWGKRRILKNDLSSLVGRLAELLMRIAHEGEEHDTQYTKRELVDAIVEVVVALPVYRTYIDSETTALTEADRHVVSTAIETAERRQRVPRQALDMLSGVLLLENFSELADHQRRERLNFIARLQQLTGPAAAKGVEDTALYVYVPFVSLNEVGGEPDLPLENAVSTFHQANVERVQEQPGGMLTVTTHDTKRSADIRSRLDVLSEWPGLWDAHVQRWHRMNRKFCRRAKDRVAPNRNTEYLYYQTLIGIWPFERDNHIPSEEELKVLKGRLTEYMLKAAREAKRRTSWVDQDQDFENALVHFIDRTLSLPDGENFLTDVAKFMNYVAIPGFWNAISRVTLHYTSPGTPDLYQGDELWNFSLVDPDNRRPVDYDRRSRLLDELIIEFDSDEKRRRMLLERLIASPEDGRIKLHVLHKLLIARRMYPNLFDETTYRGLNTTGPQAEHLLAFVREPLAAHDTGKAEETTRSIGDALLTVVPRLSCGLGTEHDQAPVGAAAWDMETMLTVPESLATDNWTNILTGQSVSLTGSTPVVSLLEQFPVAVLVRNSELSAN